MWWALSSRQTATPTPIGLPVDPPHKGEGRRERGERRVHSLTSASNICFSASASWRLLNARNVSFSARRAR